MMGLWAWYSTWTVSLLPLTPLSWEEKSRPTKIKCRVNIIQLVGGAVLCLVNQLYLTLCDPMDCSLSGSSIHRIFQARILECVAMPSSRGPSQPRDRTQVSCIAGGFFTMSATREAQVGVNCHHVQVLPTALCHHFPWLLVTCFYLQSQQCCISLIIFL